MESNYGNNTSHASEAKQANSLQMKTLRQLRLPSNQTKPSFQKPIRMTTKQKHIDEVFPLEI